MSAVRPSTSVQYRVIGMDCADDALEIREKAQLVAGVKSAKVSTGSHILTIERQGDDYVSSRLEEAVSSMGYRLHRIDDGQGSWRSHVNPAYRRALWAVVALNVGFGIVELLGGVIAGSQALKADALDFLGDGLITLFGIVALGWSLAWRARSALLQGLFLGALGLGVLATTAYRVLVQQQPEAEVMGWIALAALVVNVLAALVLIPHRAGDANARAILLFSRSDAIGNVAVIVAALLVSWTGTPWPDLVVASIVASLFLHSAWAIVRDALADLRGSA
jgi:Co/Zn/Cd efflux system component